MRYFTLEILSVPFFFNFPLLCGLSASAFSLAGKLMSKKLIAGLFSDPSRTASEYLTGFVLWPGYSIVWWWSDLCLINTMLKVIVSIPVHCFSFFIGEKQGSALPRRFGPAMNMKS